MLFYLVTTNEQIKTKHRNNKRRIYCFLLFAYTFFFSEDWSLNFSGFRKEWSKNIYSLFIIYTYILMNLSINLLTDKVKQGNIVNCSNGNVFFLFSHHTKHLCLQLCSIFLRCLMLMHIGRSILPKRPPLKVLLQLFVLTIKFSLDIHVQFLEKV